MVNAVGPGGASVIPPQVGRSSAADQAGRAGKAAGGEKPVENDVTRLVDSDLGTDQALGNAKALAGRLGGTGLSIANADPRGLLNLGNV